MAEGPAPDRAIARPVGAIDGMRTRPSGIQVGKMRVPLGVIGIIYESPERDGRCRWTLPERQRGHPAWR